MKNLLATVSLIITMLLCVIYLPHYITHFTLIIIVLCLFVSKLFNFKYVASVFVLSLLLLTSCFVVFDLKLFDVILELLKLILSTFIIASCIQNLKTKKTLLIYMVMIMFLFILITFYIYSTNQFIYKILISRYGLNTFTFVSLFALLAGSVIGFKYMNPKSKKFNTLYINGLFLTQTVTGVQRVAIEFCKEIQKKKLSYKVILLVPNCNDIDTHKIDISIKKIGIFKGIFFEQITLPFFMLFKRKSELLCIDNRGPVLYPGIVMIHDVIFCEKGYDKGKWKYFMRFILQLNIYRYNKIITVSNFSKKRIEFFFQSINPNKIFVCYIGYDHILSISKSEISIQEDYYLSVSSVLKNKNFKFIIDLAIKLPNERFVVIGKSDRVNNYFEYIPNNVMFTGYVSDDELAMLYKKCKGFISSSLYEGFGLTPLEALGFGCKKIYLSNIEVFQEIYSNVGIFFDSIEDLISKLNFNVYDELKVLKLLQNFTWEKFSVKVLHALDNKQ